MRRTRLLAIVSLVALFAVLAGCVTAPQSSDADRDRITLEATTLDEDRPLGNVNGYTATATLDLDERDLSEADLEAIKYRSMARIEEIRGLQFEEDVTFEVVTRERYQEEITWAPGSAAPHVNEAWRASFVVDGETDYNDALEEVYGGAVLGYYTNGRFVLVVDDLETIRVSRTTLVHELVHALQDQHFGLSQDGQGAGTTVDEVRAANGLLEGEANYLPRHYDRRCGVEWQCLGDLEQESESEPGPESESEPEPEPEDADAEELEERPFNVGLFLSVYAPYATGPPFVDHLHETRGWEGVDAAFENRPTSTEQVIHPDRYPDVEPTTASLEDRSGTGWEPYTDDEGDPRTEMIGEATLFATLFANGVIDRPIDEGASELAPYNYSHPVTDGWAGDTLVAYHDTDDENRTGHVWQLSWKTATDAAEFHDAYLELLENRGGEAVDVDSNSNADAHTYRISDDRPFAGAYHVSLEGETVTIVGGPTVESLSEIREPAPTAAVASAVEPVGLESGPVTTSPSAAARIDPTAVSSASLNAYA